jgi:hypothetical protein
VCGSLGAVFAADRAAEIHCVKISEIEIKNVFEVMITSNKVKSNPFTQGRLIASTFEYAAGSLFEELVKRVKKEGNTDLFVPIDKQTGKFNLDGKITSEFWTTIAHDIVTWLDYLKKTSLSSRPTPFVQPPQVQWQKMVLIPMITQKAKM